MTNQWTKVAESNDDSTVMDKLISPDFAWHRTLMIRLRDESCDRVIYTGIFNDEMPVDIAMCAPACRRYHWDIDYTLEVKERSFAEQWRICDDAPKMLYVVRKIIPHELLHKTMCEFVRASGAIVDRVKILDQIEDHVESALTDDYEDRILRLLLNVCREGKHKDIYTCLDACIRHITSGTIGKDAACIALIIYGKWIEIIHKNINFHMIAEALIT